MGCLDPPATSQVRASLCDQWFDQPTCLFSLAPVLAATASLHPSVPRTPRPHPADSYPSMLYLAYKHADSFEGAVLANTNAGGENCHRGAALGALMGSALGEKAIPKRLIEGLAASGEIKKEIDAFCDAAFGTAAGAPAATAHAEL